jgi:hypothetical protein
MDNGELPPFFSPEEAADEQGGNQSIMRKLSIITLLFLVGAIFFVETVFVNAAAAAGKPPVSQAVETERRGERLKRFLQRTIDDLKESHALAEEDISELDKQIDAITPLESSQREADFQSLLDWYYGYLGWLKEQIEEFDDDLTQLSSFMLSDNEEWGTRFEEIINMQKGLNRDLQDKVKRFSAEEKRLAGILERRRLLQSHFNDLQDRLVRIEKKADRERPLSEKEKNKADRIRVDVNVVQTELLSLPQVDEDLLKHYAVMIERGKWENEWLALKIGEYETLRDVAALLSRYPSRSSAEFEAAYRRVTRMYEGEISRLNRKVNELDRQQSRVTPAGSLREMDRSRELADFYDRLRIRYNDRISRIKIQIGAYEAESAEIRSAKP